MDAYFNIHFFRENSRQIDVNELINLFEKIEGTEICISDDILEIKYIVPRLGYKAVFAVTRKSIVPGIHRINPKYLDLNFHLEIQILTPDYIFKKLLEIVREITNRFGYYVYNEFLEDVRAFNYDIMLKVFGMVKEAYASRNSSIMHSYRLLGKDKLNAIFRYLDELYQLQLYYKDLDTYVPHYLFLEDSSRNVYIAIEWKEGTCTVFPPYVDYIYYTNESGIKIIDYKEFISVCSKFLSDVPGFIKGAKVFSIKQNRKIHKAIKKAKFDGIKTELVNVRLESLVD